MRDVNYSILYFLRCYLFMNVLILDNYDSFTYNLFHYLKPLAKSITVKRNDEITIEACAEYSHLVFSPGPGLPKKAGILTKCIKKYKKTKPMLGICLGMQAIAESYKGRLYNQQNVKHGICESIDLLKTESGLFKGLPNNCDVGLYHSWAVENKKTPKEFEITAVGKTGVIMGLQHKTLPIYGVQFHPESVLTEHGKKMIENWVLETR